MIGIGSFDSLKIDIRILGRTPQFRAFRIHSPCTELGNGIPVHQFGHIRIIDHLDFLDFVRRAKPIEEMGDRQTCLDGAEMRHKSQVHGLLDRSRRKQCKSGLPNCHDILVIAEYGQRMTCHGTGRHMKNAGKNFTCDFIHVGYHQEKAL